MASEAPTSSTAWGSASARASAQASLSRASASALRPSQRSAEAALDQCPDPRPHVLGRRDRRQLVAQREHLGRPVGQDGRLGTREVGPQVGLPFGGLEFLRATPPVGELPRPPHGAPRGLLPLLPAVAQPELHGRGTGVHLDRRGVGRAGQSHRPSEQPLGLGRSAQVQGALRRSEDRLRSQRRGRRPTRHSRPGVEGDLVLPQFVGEPRDRRSQRGAVRTVRVGVRSDGPEQVEPGRPEEPPLR